MDVDLTLAAIFVKNLQKPEVIFAALVDRTPYKI